MVFCNYVTNYELRNGQNFHFLSFQVDSDDSFGTFLAVYTENSQKHDYYVTLSDDVMVTFHHDF